MWQTIVDVFSLLGGLFALIAMWLYLRPRAIITIETYEYVPGTGQRRFRLLVRNPGNVPVRILRMIQKFQDDTPPDEWTDISPMFTGRTSGGRVLPPSTDIPVWLDERDMRRRTAFIITYRGWVPRNYWAEVRFDVRNYGVNYNMAARMVGTSSMMATATVERPGTEAEGGKMDFAETLVTGVAAVTLAVNLAAPFTTKRLESAHTELSYNVAASESAHIQTHHFDVGSLSGGVQWLQDGPVRLPMTS